MEKEYRYLFPYEKIPYASKIIIYGAGDLGQGYLKQMMITGYCEVVAIADRNHKKYPPMIVPVIAPDYIKNYQFDYVVVALRMEAAYPETVRVLHSQEICDDKIVCVFERKTDEVSIFSENGASNGNIAYAYNLSNQSIAILTTGGFGDMVIQKRFVMELIKYAPDCRLDFFNIKAIDFLKYLYSDVKNVNVVIDDLGFRYRANKDKYSLAMTIEACHFIRVDVWDEKESSAVFSNEFVKRISTLKARSDEEGIGINTPAYLTMTRRRFKGLNAYNGFNYDGAFDINDKDVNIPLDKDFQSVYENLDLKSYITVNFGNGDSEGAEGIAKSWHNDSFEIVIQSLKSSYPDIQIVQLGGKNAEKLKGIDRYLLGEDFRLVLHVLKNSLIHIDIEGGLVHIATQLGTKCVVLFGPTVLDYYGYEQNINLRAGNCHECWGLYSNVNRCARDLKVSECMKSITPKMVIDAVEEYLAEMR